MNNIILPFDPVYAEEILRGKRTMIPWIKNFKRYPIENIVVSLKAPTGLMAIGYVKVISKSWISKYTASDRILLADGSLPKMYWYDYEDVMRVCLFNVRERYVFENPIYARNLTNGRDVGSGVYLEIPIPEGSIVRDEVM